MAALLSGTNQPVPRRRPFRDVFIAYCVAAILLCILFYFVNFDFQNISKLQQMGVRLAAGLSMLFLSLQTLNSFALYIAMKAFRIQLGFFECFGLICMQSLGNYFPFNAGAVSNAIYLKYRKGVDIANYISYMTGRTLLIVLIYGMVTSLCIAVRYFQGYSFNMMLFCVSLCLVFTPVMITCAPIPEIMPGKKIPKWLAAIHKGWKIMIDEKWLLINSSMLSIATLAVCIVRYLFVFHSMEYRIDAFAVATMTAFSTMAKLTFVIPGDLGIRETVAGGVAYSFGELFSIGVIATATIRIVALFWIFVLGIPFTFFLARHGSGEATMKARKRG